MKPDWEPIKRLVGEEYARIQALLADLPPKVVGVAFQESFPPRVVIRMGYDAAAFKMRSQYIDATLGALARLTLEDCDALGALITIVQGNLRGRLIQRTEFWLQYELKPPYHKLIDAQEAAAAKKSA